MNYAVEIENLKKYFGEVKAVDGLTFTVEEGKLFAFLGVNGAGKSTTINVMCSILQKDEGRVKLCGFDLDEEGGKIRAATGIVFQDSILDKALTVRENLAVRAGFYGLFGNAWEQRLGELCELLDLRELLGRPYGKLSGGQRRRTDVARGILNRPRLLILDEPTTGLDPQTRQNVWNAIETLRRRNNMTVFLTTHYMEEANRADDVVILDGGRIAAQGSPVALKNRYSCDHIRLYGERSAETEKKLAGLDVSYSDNRYSIRVKDSAEAKAVIAKYGDALTDFEVVKGDMDDVFLNVTGKKLTGGEHA